VDVAARALGSAAWQGREHAPSVHLWPHQFSQLADVYAERFGLDDKHLRAIARKNFANAKHNPNAQTRAWTLNNAHFSDNEALNPSIAGRVRRQDCSQLTDGAVAIVLASDAFAQAHARRCGTGRFARITGFGHRTGPMPLAPKLDRFRPDALYLLPEVRNAIVDAYTRARISGPEALDGVETHDCFTISEYIAMDHFGLTPPGHAWRAIEAGVTARGGKLPFNMSGGLIGAGHPVGATGVRMVLDAMKQVTGTADAMQVEGAKRYATLNIGGSAASAVCFIVEG
jgi:acetyl-CoA C-acetyltransferase